MHDTTRWTTRAAAGGAAIALLSGCGALTERAVESALERVDGVEDVDLSRDGDGFAFSTEDGSMTMDGSSGEVSIETEDGQMRSGAATEVPDAIAARLQLPAGFEVTNATEMAGADGARTTAVGGSLPGATMAETVAAFTGMLADAGLTVARRTESAEFSNLVTEEPEGETGTMVTVLLFGDGDDITVQLTLAER